jgi:hypothetical protein
MTSHADNSALRWICNYPDHEHLSWEEADCCDYLLPLLAKLQCGSGDTALSYGLPVDYLGTALMLNPDEAYSRTYTRLQELYESAGRPDGPDEAGFWRWIENMCMPRLRQ